MKSPAFAPMVLAVALMTSGCGLLKDKTYTPTEAEKKLAAFCQKEGKLTVITHRIGRSLWVYAPLEEALFEIKAARDTDKPDREVQPLSLLALVAEYSQRYFKFSYDIVPDVLSGEPTTYRTGYNETYTKKRQLIYQGLQESFFNAKTSTHDLMPEFVVIMVADTSKGISTKSVLYLKDLRQYITEAIPPDEYYMREYNEVIGKEDLIHDTKGVNVPYAEVTWTYFLTQQIKTRIKYAFTDNSKGRSGDDDDTDSPAKKDSSAFLAKAAANTLRLYPFSDYDGVVLYDLRAKKELALKKEDLKKFAEKATWEETQGRLTTIHFEVPKDPSSGLGAITTTSTSDKKLNVTTP